MREELLKLILFVKADTRALMELIRRLEKPLTNANWEHEGKLLARCSRALRQSLMAVEKMLND